LSDELIRRLRGKFAEGGLLHYGQGKWYPGESLPRWAYSCFWRRDGQPIWKNPALLADLGLTAGKADATKPVADEKMAAAFMCELVDRLHVEDRWIRPAYEDMFHMLEIENKMPVDVDPRKFDPDADEDRRRLSRALERGVSRPVGFVLPLTRAWWQANAKWTSGFWPFRSHKLFLIPGDSPMGLRLPLESLPVTGSSNLQVHTRDPFAERVPLPGYAEIRKTAQERLAAEKRDCGSSEAKASDAATGAD
jgi:uncharacterized protein (DUF2126 family)